MKKSTRILSLVLALMMMLGTFSVLGSAYEAYKDSAITNWNDIDKPIFTTEQYASMAADELDRMLAEEQLYLSEDDIFVGELDVRSINALMNSLDNLLDTVGGLLDMLGDAKALTIDPLRYDSDNMKQVGTSANPNGGNITDVELFESLIGFLGANKGIFTAYIGGNFNLGVLDSVIADFKYNARNIVFGLLKSELDDSIEWDEYKPADGETIDDLLQTFLNYKLIGDYTDSGTALSLNMEVGKNGKETPIKKGELWKYIEDLDYAKQKDIINNTINICTTTENAYDFIENLLQEAFDLIAVPELNNYTRPWLRETAGIVYDKNKVNNPDYPNYDGEAWTLEDENIDQQLAAIFKLDTMAIPKYQNNTAWTTWASAKGATIKSTLVDNLNSFFGYALTQVINGEQYTTKKADLNGYYWDYTKGNAAFLTNVANVARYVLMHSGDKFFSAYIKIPTVAEYQAMNEQQIYSFVIRAILNSSVDWLYIGDECQTIADVLYECAYQMAWQDIPQQDYTKPVRTNYTNDADYYSALLNAGLDIMMDIAVFNLNQDIDMVPAKRTAGQSPAVNKGSGLLEYGGSWSSRALQIITWGIHNYAGMLTTTGCTLDAIQLDPNGDGTVGSVTVDDMWEDIDLIFNSLVPLSSTIENSKKVWIHQDIATETNSKGGSDVVRSILFDYLVGDILNLDFSGISTIFSRNTDQGTLTTSTVKNILIELVTNLLNLIFPGTINTKYPTLDAVLQNGILASIVGNILDKFDYYKSSWIQIALPILCDMLDLTDAQEFAEMESYMPTNISSTVNNVAFQVYNGCSGLNTSNTIENGKRTVDNLYKYVIQGVTCTTTSGSVSATGVSKGTVLNGGDSKTVTIATSDASNFVQDSVITLTITYKVQDETGNFIQSGDSDALLACTKYAYVGATAEDDSEIRSNINIDSNVDITYYPSIYMNRGRSLTGANSYTIAVKLREKTPAGSTATVNSVSGVDWLKINSDGKKLSASASSAGKGTLSLAPIEVDSEKYERYTYNYSKLTVTAENFATYLETGNLCVKNAYGGYDKLAATAVYSEDTVYYAFSDNANAEDNTKTKDGKKTLVKDGVYDVTINMTVNGVSKDVPVKIFLYNDYSLASLYNNAVTANRQSTDFTDADVQWNAYSTALSNAGMLVLAPKNCSTFASKMATTNTKYPNKYLELYVALSDAIEALDKKAVSAGVEELKAAVETYVGRSNSYYLTQGKDTLLTTANEKYGWNEVAYYATATEVENNTSRYAHTYWGYRDYVAHTYRKFRSAKNDAEKLIDKVTFYPPVEPEKPEANASVYEYNKYQEEYAAYQLAYDAYIEKTENLVTLNPVDVAYALHMVNLTGSRLLTVASDSDKLQEAFDKFATLTEQDKVDKQYTTKTWTAYTHAVNFADATLKDSAAKPSQITTALSELIEARKELASGVDYKALNSKITAAKAIDTTIYTADSVLALSTVIAEAEEIVAADWSDSTANQNEVDAMVIKIQTAIDGLKTAASKEPTYELTPENVEIYDWTWAETVTPYFYESFWAEMFEKKLIAGVGAELDGSLVDDLFACENCYAVWEMNTFDNNSYSTNSTITIYNEADDSVLDQYYICLIGDTNGDNEVNANDVAWAKKYGSSALVDPDLVVQGLACDVDYDEDVTPNDYALLKKAIANKVTIYQDGREPEYK